MYAYVFVYIHVCVCVCVYVWEGERERGSVRAHVFVSEKEREKGNKKKAILRERERERKRERERERNREREREREWTKFRWKNKMCNTHMPTNEKIKGGGRGMQDWCMAYHQKNPYVAYINPKSRVLWIKIRTKIWFQASYSMRVGELHYLALTKTTTESPWNVQTFYLEIVRWSEKVTIVNNQSNIVPFPFCYFVESIHLW